MSKPVEHGFLRGRRRWRAGLSQLVSIFAGVSLGLLMPLVEFGPTVPARQVTDMLVAVGLGLLGSIAVIFSLLFLVVQWAATTFTPRLTLFRDDPIVWRTFAFAVGQAVFSITAALAIGNRARVSVVVPIIAVLLLLAMLAFLRALQIHSFAAIQLAPVLKSIGSRGRAVLGAYYSTRGSESPSPPLALPADHTTIVWPNPPAVLHEIIIDDLLEAATVAQVVVVLQVMQGDTLLYGASVADVHRGSLSAPTFLDALFTCHERTFDGDPLLALRLLADIALRALSPAVNDPATAVQALDEIEDLLTRVASVDTAPTYITDSSGHVRVVLSRPTLDDYVQIGLDDVIASATTSPMTVDRLRALLMRLTTHCRPEHAAILEARLNRINGLDGPGSPFDTVGKSQ